MSILDEWGFDIMDELTQSFLGILKGIFGGYTNYVTGLIKLAKLEAQLAAESAILIIVLLFILSIIALSAWFVFLVLIFFILTSYNFTPINASLIILAGNFSIMLIIFVCIYRLKNNLTFAATRRQLHIPIMGGPKHEQIETKNKRRRR